MILVLYYYASQQQKQDGSPRKDGLILIEGLLLYSFNN